MEQVSVREDEKLILQLFETAGYLERRLDRVLSYTRGISFREYHMLRELALHFNDAATRVDLAAAVGLTPSAVTRALKPLEKLGYIQTRKDERDARRSLAMLTETGQTLYREAQTLVQEQVNLLPLDQLNRTDLAQSLATLTSR